jgi:hypothetical protein
LISLLLSFAQVAPLDAPADPVAATISAIRAYPGKFDG